MFAVKPFLTPEEMAQTRSVVEKFAENEGKELHLMLMERAKYMKNWVRPSVCSKNPSIITSAKEVFNSRPFVCLLTSRIMQILLLVDLPEKLGLGTT